MTGRHRLPSCGDPHCYWRRHRLAGWLMPRRPYPWEDFHEDDEPLEKIQAAFDAGVKGVTRRPVTSWEGEDAFTGWRKVLHWQKGELRKVKRRESKRDRRRARDEIRQEESHE